jgi:hypothetical protein
VACVVVSLLVANAAKVFGVGCIVSGIYQSPGPEVSHHPARTACLLESNTVTAVLVKVTHSINEASEAEERVWKVSHDMSHHVRCWEIMYGGECPTGYGRDLCAVCQMDANFWCCWVVV